MAGQVLAQTQRGHSSSCVAQQVKNKRSPHVLGWTLNSRDPTESSEQLVQWEQTGQEKVK